MKRLIALFVAVVLISYIAFPLVREILLAPTAVPSIAEVPHVEQPVQPTPIITPAPSPYSPELVYGADQRTKISAYRLSQQELDRWISNYTTTGQANSQEKELLRLINNKRTSSNLSALSTNSCLMMGARFKAQSMSDLRYFNTEHPVYGNFKKMVGDLFGYPSQVSMALNIGSGYRNASEVFRIWSDGTVVTNERFTEVGIGFYNNYWALIISEGLCCEAVAILARSSITIPDRILTESELEVWFAEYDVKGMNTYELDVIRLTNQERNAQGLSTLLIDPELMRIARFKAQSMSDIDYIDHYGVYGSPTDLARALGYNGSVGENLARGVSSPKYAVESWMNSPAHRENLLYPRYQTIGVGAYINEQGYMSWVQVFSTRTY